MSTLKMLEYSDFNPRSREGSDCSLSYALIHVGHFNPRSREGSDQKDTSHILLNTDFNPRSREGSDNIFDLIDLCADLFQSTLPRGERRVSAKSKKRAVDISIHAPARGATLSCCLCIFCQCNFNPRSREGSD